MPRSRGGGGWGHDTSESDAGCPQRRARQHRAVAAPEAEIELSVGLVRSLLAEQRPDLADLAIAEVASGWDNVVFRVGDDLAARHAAAGDRGATWPPTSSGGWPSWPPGCRCPVPAPVFVGEPGPGYPWPWAIVPWFHGDEAARAEPERLDSTRRSGSAASSPPCTSRAPDDAPPNPYRAVPLAGSRRSARGRASTPWATTSTALGSKRGGPRCVATPEWAGPKRLAPRGPRTLATSWSHEGRLAAVVDFGDMTAGDPAVDLSVAWFWLPPSVRDAFRSAYGGRGRRHLAPGQGLGAVPLDRPPRWRRSGHPARAATPSPPCSPTRRLSHAARGRRR